MRAAIQGKKSIKAYYKDKAVASKYISQRYSSLFGLLEHKLECRAINSMLKKIRPEKLLDIAIGTGRVAQCLKYYKQGFGIDTSREMLNAAQKELKGWVLREDDAFEMGFKDNFFDVIVSMRFIWHFAKKEREILFKQIHSRLKTNGLFIFDAPNANVKRIVPFKEKIGKKRIYTHLWALESLKKELNKNGFKLVEAKPTLKNAPLLCKISDKMASFSGYCIMRFLSSFSRKEPFTYIVLARKI